jgi:uncharacterized NAD-dependent epimerase/dehydratase family protein
MKRKLVVLAEKRFGPVTSKMANGAIRYIGDQVVAVIDSRNAGKCVQDVLGFGGDIPVYESLDEAMRHEPNTLLIGISPLGGKFPSEWYSLIISAIQNKLHIISGLHEYLSDIAEFRVLAEKYSVRIQDLRRFTKSVSLCRGLARKFQSKIILTVGSHGNVGKMTTTIELVRQMQKRGKAADWVATGQIGMLIKGKGVPVDTVKGDFISGAVESATAAMDGKFEYVFVEGQGSLQHLGFSSVALGIMHGCLPDAMILCHRTDIGVSDYGVKTDDLVKAIDVNERMLSFIKKSPVIGISLNTYHLNEEKAKQKIDEIAEKTGLPTTDPIRFGADVLSSALISHFKGFRKRSH